MESTNSKITVNQVITRGYLLLIVIPIGMMLLFGISVSYFIEHIETQSEQGQLNPEITLFPIPILIAFLILFVIVVRNLRKYYRKWALDNVDNLEAFRTRALNAKFITNDDPELEELIQAEKRSRPKSSDQSNNFSFGEEGRSNFSSIPEQENYVFYYTAAGNNRYALGLCILLIPAAIAAYLAGSIISMLFNVSFEMIISIIIGANIIKTIWMMHKHRKQYIRLDAKGCLIYHTNYLSYSFFSFGFGLSGETSFTWGKIQSISLKNNKIKIVNTQTDRGKRNHVSTFIFGTKGSETNPEEIVEVMQRFLPIRSNTDWKNEV